MSILISNIKGLVYDEPLSIPKSGDDLGRIKILENAYLLIENNLVADYGRMDQVPAMPVAKAVDATGCFVLPSFVDSHTHIVYSGSREGEFVQKIQGLSYQEIAERGGGILNSAKRLAETSEEDLYDQASGRIEEVIRLGTGAVEIKSGYGLTMEAELKMLRVIRRLKEASPLEIRSTFLGAHAVPTGTTKEEYIEVLLNDMLPAVASEGLADYCDVFCEKGFFSPDESRRILERGGELGLKPKVHANQLSLSGGVQVGVQVGAISVDHLETMGQEEIDCLAGSETIGTLLPGAAFFLGMNFPPARKLIEAGIPVALASDYNPGSAPSGSMPFLLSLACVMMKMTPEEAINASTVNGAFAIDLQDTHGSISRGKQANLFITKPIPSLPFLPYSFGSQLIDIVILRGEVV